MLRIGFGTTSTSGLLGWLDEVQVYKRALSATDIKRIYDAGPLGVCLPVP